jgi:hypothetical protein
MTAVFPRTPGEDPYESDVISRFPRDDFLHHCLYVHEREREFIKSLASRTDISVIDIRLGDYFPRGYNFHLYNNFLNDNPYNILRDIITLIIRYLQNTTHITTFKVWFARDVMNSNSAVEKFNRDMLSDFVCMLRHVRSIRYLFVQGYEYAFLRHKLNAPYLIQYDVLGSLNANVRQHSLRTDSLFEMMSRSKYAHISPFKFHYNLVPGAFFIVKKKGKEHSFMQYQFFYELSKDLYLLKCNLVDKKNRKTKYVAYRCVNYVVRCSRYIQNGLSLKRIRLSDTHTLDYYNYVPSNYIPH